MGTRVRTGSGAKRSLSACASLADMKAVQITSLDGPSAVELVELPSPEPAANQVLIRVRAAGVAFPEVLQSRGLYQLKPDLPFTPGAEIAGEVISAPDGSGFSPGDRVAALCLLG